MLFSFLKKFNVEETKKTLFSLNATDREAFLSQNLQVADNEEIGIKNG